MNNIRLRSRKFFRRFKRNPLQAMTVFVKNRFENKSNTLSNNVKQYFSNLRYGSVTFNSDLIDLIAITANIKGDCKTALQLKEGRLLVSRGQEKDVDKAIRKLFWEVLKDPDPKTLPIAVKLKDIYEGFSEGVDEREKYLEKMKRQNLGMVDLALSVKNHEINRNKFASNSGNKVGYFVHNCLPYSNGGYAIRTDYIATALKAKGLDFVCVARLGFPSDLSTEYQVENSVENIHGVKYLYNDEEGRDTHHLNDYLRLASNYYEKVIV
jgi:hypothetical protein